MYDLLPIFQRVANRLSGVGTVRLVIRTLAKSQYYGKFTRSGEDECVIELNEHMPIDQMFDTLLHEIAHATHLFEKYAIVPSDRYLLPSGSQDAEVEARTDEDRQKYLDDPFEKIANLQTKIWIRMLDFIEDRYGHQDRDDVVQKKCVALLVLPLDELIPIINTDSNATNTTEVKIVNPVLGGK